MRNRLGEEERKKGGTEVLPAGQQRPGGLGIIQPRSLRPLPRLGALPSALRASLKSLRSYSETPHAHVCALEARSAGDTPSITHCFPRPAARWDSWPAWGRPRSGRSPCLSSRCRLRSTKQGASGTPEAALPWLPCLSGRRTQFKLGILCGALAWAYWTGIKPHTTGKLPGSDPRPRFRLADGVIVARHLQGPRAFPWARRSPPETPGSRTSLWLSFPLLVHAHAAEPS